MRTYTPLVVILVLAVVGGQAPARAGAPPAEAEDADGDVAEEPAGGADVSPVEIIPKVELRQSFTKIGPGTSVHDTIGQMDIQFLRRVLLRYQLPRRLLDTPTGTVSGFGDVQLTLIGIVGSNATRLFAVIAGAVLDTATQPQLGAGKQQLVFGVAAAFKPVRFLLPYGIVQEQISVAGDGARPAVNELTVDLGIVLFGKQYNWLKLDLVPTVDFPGGARGRISGTFEVGSLVIGRVGLFIRTGTQLAGQEQLDYQLAAGVRYLFRLETGKPRADP